ncbi:hypothetical protein H310_02404 [Aphanomyces invadans]|uniref:Uncharacterized protein n=1 Tax=Aphanomyces invadans TaxID=157072 RepID=A0A024UP05_9STRA|nr:hypothetical protein H310_02404 [Aphanomyces invadans]ETW08029.1 hypothetical protein H310_02404 [Aphanomyces invadans]|eukprot:XP_008864122.1 hypothetical protein H310_02404 [Aphanomyces invadans]
MALVRVPERRRQLVLDFDTDNVLFSMWRGRANARCDGCEEVVWICRQAHAQLANVARWNGVDGKMRGRCVGRAENSLDGTTCATCAAAERADFEMAGKRERVGVPHG